MIIILVKIKCDHCERFHEQEVEIELRVTGWTTIRYLKEPPMGWTRTITGYTVCVRCQEEYEREAI